MQQAMRKRHYIYSSFIAALLVVGGVALLGATTPWFAGAQQSQLEQQIYEPGCPSSEQCMLPPTIETINKNGGRPIFSGRYDATLTQSLRVTFGGRVYALGNDPELTVENGEWLLDLGHLSPPLETGDYTFIVETVDLNDEVQQVTIVVIFRSTDIDKPDDTKGNTDPSNRPVPNVPNTGLLRHQAFPVTVIILVILSVGILLLLLRRNTQQGSTAKK